MLEGAAGASSLRWWQTSAAAVRERCFHGEWAVKLIIVGLEKLFSWRLICASDCPACCVRADRSALQPRRSSVWEVSRPAAAALDVRTTVHLLQVGLHPNIYWSTEKTLDLFLQLWISLVSVTGNQLQTEGLNLLLMPSYCYFSGLTFTAMTHLGTRPWRTCWKLCWISQVLVPSAWRKRKKTTARKTIPVNTIICLSSTRRNRSWKGQ